MFFPGVWVCLRDFILFLFFLAALSANLHCGKTLGLEKSLEHGKVFQEYGWETRTFEEGKKKAPLIQGGGLRQAHTIEKVENPSSRLLNIGIKKTTGWGPQSSSLTQLPNRKVAEKTMVDGRMVDIT